MLLLIDNYDSFAHNLARYFTRLGCDLRVVRNDRLSVADVGRWQAAAIILSPGPCTPQEAGCSIELIRAWHTRVPMLGVCLGHQSIVAALGGRLVRSAPMHGRTSAIHHDQQGVFEGIPNPFQACRYHSLVADRASLPAPLQVSGETDDGLVMAVRHRDFPVVGLQFHPEAILTQHGFVLLANFLRLAGLPHRDPEPCIESEWKLRPSRSAYIPDRPVTF